MNILILSNAGELRPLCQRFEDAGHLAFLYNNSPISKPLDIRVDEPPMLFDAQERQDIPEELYRKADVIISNIPYSLVNCGKPHIGGTKFNSMLQYDEKYRKGVLMAAGLDYARNADDIKMALVGWFNGGEFVHPIMALFKHTRMMDNDLGVGVGCSMASLTSLGEVNIAEATILKLQKVLAKSGYKGALQLGFVIIDKKPVITEIVTEPDITFLACFAELCHTPLPEIVISVAHDKRVTIPLRHEWAGAVLVSVAPFPFASPILQEPQKVSGIEQEALKHLWAVDVVGAADDLSTGQTSGLLGYCTARGASLGVVRSRIMRTLKRIECNNIQYRSDFGENVESMLQALKGWRG